MTRSIHQRSSFESEILVLYEVTSSNLFKDNLDFYPSSKFQVYINCHNEREFSTFIRESWTGLRFMKNICSLFSGHVIGVMIKVSQNR